MRRGLDNHAIHDIVTYEFSAIESHANERGPVMSIYDFTVKAQDGSEVSLSDYKGKVLLIVNTATGCGFTPQYDELQDLYELHQEEVL